MSSWEDVLLDQGDHRKPAEWWWAYVTETDPLRIRREMEDTPLGATPSTLIAGLRVSDKVRVVNHHGQALIVGVAGGGIPTAPIAAGEIYITPSNADTPTEITITFPTGRFTDVPTSAWVTPRTGVPGKTVTGVAYSDLTETSMNVWLTRTNTTRTLVGWGAIQI